MNEQKQEKLHKNGLYLTLKVVRIMQNMIYQIFVIVIYLQNVPTKKFINLRFHYEKFVDQSAVDTYNVFPKYIFYIEFVKLIPMV